MYLNLENVESLDPNLILLLFANLFYGSTNLFVAKRKGFL